MVAKLKKGLPMKSVNNISEWVTVQASERPHQRALVFPEGRDKAYRRMYTQLTFAQTESMINRMARGFQQAGIKRRTGLCVHYAMPRIHADCVCSVSCGCNCRPH